VAATEKVKSPSNKMGDTVKPAQGDTIATSNVLLHPFESVTKILSAALVKQVSSKNCIAVDT
jgi:hypothetical protein